MATERESPFLTALHERVLIGDGAMGTALQDQDLTLDDFEIHIDVIRPGRTIELIEATVSSGGRTAVRARVWRLATYPTSPVAGGQPRSMPARDGLERMPLTDIGKPVKNATVGLEGAAEKVTTDVRGRFKLRAPVGATGANVGIADGH